MKVLFDSTIIIDALKRIEPAIDEIRLYEDRAISVVTWIEVMVGARARDAEAVTREFLSRFGRIELSPKIAEEAVLVRQEYRLRLPDAIILATARSERRMLLTRDSRDFGGSTGVLIPYRL